MPASHIAAISTDTAGVPPPGTASALRLGRCAPNPAGSSAEVRFELPYATRVRLGLYDVRGRRVVHVLDGQSLDEGAHTVTLRLARLDPGVYFCRLAAAERSITRKLVIAR